MGDFAATGETDFELIRFKKRLQYLCCFAATAGISILFSMQVVFATGGGGTAPNNIWTQFSNVMRDIYTQLLGISTILAVTAAAVALIVRMVSRNQRAVDEATSWLKRIVITWIILNTMGFFIAYIQPWLAGGQYTP